MKFYIGLILLSGFLFIFSMPVDGQSVFDGFDPNADDTVLATAVQPDGKILIAGQFTTVAGTIRNRVARLNPNGTLDTAFDPNANGIVRSIAIQPDGKILIGGDFTDVGGQTRNRIARLDTLTGVADPFDPSADNIVRSIVLQNDGKILAGGDFTSIGGQPRNHIARLDAATGSADAFDPNGNDVVRALALQPDGRILAGGEFTSIGGQARNRIARIHPVSGLADTFNPNAESTVSSIALQADGKVLIGGDFANIDGQVRHSLARVSSGVGSVDTFNPDVSGAVRSVVMQADGNILIGGDFTAVGGQIRLRIARLNAATGSLHDFVADANDEVEAIAVQSDGKIIVTGAFTGISSEARNHIARLESDGSLDRTLDTLIEDDGFVAATALQPDGKIIIGGFFSSVMGVPRSNIARLNADGTLDVTFDVNADDTVYAIALQADGGIVIGGIFTNVGGQTRNYLARLDGTTGEVDDWNPNASEYVVSVLVLPDGKIVVAGNFNGPNSMGALTRNHIARLDPVTGVADSWNPNARGQVLCLTLEPAGTILAGGTFSGTNSIGGANRNYIARLNPTTGAADSSFISTNLNNGVISMGLQPDGKILITGNFTREAGIGFNRMGRLNPNGTFDLTFSPNANAQVLSFAVQTDGKIVVGGNFNGTNSIGGSSRNYIARLEPGGSADPTFNPNANATVNSIAILPDGKILAGGHFTTMGGQPRTFLARFSNDTAASRSLAVTQSSVTLTLDRASPRFARVLFELSTNGQNYSFLGSGTGSLAPSGNARGQISQIAPAAAGWTLTGLSLPTGQNIYIRARGISRTGYHNGSESITETVKNVFLSGPTAAHVSVSGRVLSASGGFVPRATVFLSGSDGEIRTALTSSLGYYRFENVAAGRTYTLSVSAKQYRFASQVVTINDDIFTLDFSALP